MAVMKTKNYRQMIFYTAFLRMDFLYAWVY